MVLTEYRILFTVKFDHFQVKMASKLIKRTLEEAAQVEHAEIDFSDKVPGTLQNFCGIALFHTMLSHYSTGPYFAICEVSSNQLLNVFHRLRCIFCVSFIIFMLSFIVILQGLKS
jgi:hypothetical protein